MRHDISDYDAVVQKLVVEDFYLLGEELFVALEEVDNFISNLWDVQVSALWQDIAGILYILHRLGCCVCLEDAVEAAKVFIHESFSAGSFAAIAVSS